MHYLTFYTKYCSTIISAAILGYILLSYNAVIHTNAFWNWVEGWGFSKTHLHFVYIPLQDNLEEATERLAQMTLATLLLVVAMLVLLVIISIVQAIYVYHKLKGVTSTPNSNIPAHKGPLIGKVLYMHTTYACVSNSIFRSCPIRLSAWHTSLRMCVSGMFSRAHTC